MKSKAKKVPQKRAAVSTPEDAVADPKFLSDLETRGEVAELTPEGKLPKGATHAKIKKPDGTVVVKRGRYNLVG